MTAWSNSTRRARLPKDWPARRNIVLQRDAWTCQLRYPGCTIVATDVDHVRAGDDHSLTNLQAACNPCHKHKTAAESQQARGVGAARRRPQAPHPGLRGGG